MTHDFKKGDPVILEDGRTGILKSLLVCIAEVEVDHHYKYVDVKTLKHKRFCWRGDGGSRVCDLPPNHLEDHHFVYVIGGQESRAGEAVAELETIPVGEGYHVEEWVDYKPSDPWPDKPNGQEEYEKIMADGCDPEPEAEYVDTTTYEIYCEEHPDKCCPMHCCADDGPEVEILRSKP